MADDASRSAPILPESFDECVELYFECETPEERDGFVQLFGEREGSDVIAFLRAMMVEDEDAFVQVAAARALARRGDEDGQRRLTELLSVSVDDGILAAAIAATVGYKHDGAADELVAMFLDEERSHGERRLAQDGLMQASLDRAARVFVELLESPAVIDVELVEGMMPALIDASSAQRQQAIAALERRAQAQREEHGLIQATVSLLAEGDEKERALDRADEARDGYQSLSACQAQLLAADDPS